MIVTLMNQKTKKPNIIYIFSDQHRADTIGALGHQTVITPNLDKLCQEGVSFTQCFTNSPLCMPARASMMTGQFVCEHGVWDNHTEVNPRKASSHVRNIQSAGYHTALIGKTHLYSTTSRDYTDMREQIPLMEDWGFTESDETTGHMASYSRDSSYSDYLHEKKLLTPYRKASENYIKKWRQGNDLPWEQEPSPLPSEDYLDSYVGNKTVDWIEKYHQNNEEDKPFYLQVLFPGPHEPFDSPQKYRDLYDSSKNPIAIMEYPDGPIPFYTNMVLKWSNLKGMTPAQNQLYRSYYYAKITLIDEWIGKIVKSLEKTGLLENTWIIYSSDHGEMIGDHMLNHKMVFYEGAIRVPCLIRPPGGTEKKTFDKFVDLIDVTTTILDIAGAKAMSAPNGVSLLPVVKQNEENVTYKGKDVIFSEVQGFTMVRTEKYKLVISSRKKKPVEFYDLVNDPDELHNRVNHPDYLSAQKELLQKHLKPFLRKMSGRKYRSYWLRSVKRFLFSNNYPDWVKRATLGKD